MARLLGSGLYQLEVVFILSLLRTMSYRATGKQLKAINLQEEKHFNQSISLFPQYQNHNQSRNKDKCKLEVKRGKVV